MVFEGEIVGRYVTLRSATIEDAEFTLAIRQDKKITQYIPYLDITLEQQIAWIKKQRETEGDYFFVVWNKKNERIGTNSIYDIKNSTGETGRLTMKNCSALESLENQFLLSSFAFEILKLEETHSYTYEDNSRALRFSDFFGYTIQSEKFDKQDKKVYKSSLNSENFLSSQEKLCKLIYRSTKNFFSIRNNA
ncbi:MAG: GNAT family N-acetyltransferase [Selenomonadaceae bacterium]|nr:GNAT family N-acetyltransferase [Selenomonadaceae bacterium]